MAPRVKHGGRQKGTPNKTTTAVKEALIAAFDRMGGVDSLVEWGQANQTEFYKLWVKILPAQVNDDGSGSTAEPVRVVIQVEDASQRDGE